MSNKKTAARQKIRFRIRKKISGTSEAPRLSVFRSNSEIYAQLIDDNSGLTLASASSKQKDINAQKAPKTELSKMVGEAIAKKATELGIKKVIFESKYKIEKWVFVGNGFIMKSEFSEVADEN